MNNTLLRFLMVVVFACVSAPLSASEGSLWKSLTPDQKAQLPSGKPVVTEEEVEGNPWPKLTINQLVKASPAQVAAVFWNSELDTKYLPNCSSARVIARPSRSVQEARFTLKMPLFLPDELHVSRITVKRPVLDTYEIAWNVLESRYSKECSGTIRIEPHGDHSLISYQTLVKPRGNFAGLLRWPAQVIIVDSVKALARQVETEAATQSPLLSSQLQALGTALGLPAESLR